MGKESAKTGTPGRDTKGDRRTRAAAALRANLRRRKAQARERGAAEGGADPGPRKDSREPD